MPPYGASGGRLGRITEVNLSVDAPAATRCAGSSAAREPPANAANSHPRPLVCGNKGEESYTNEITRQGTFLTTAKTNEVTQTNEAGD